jgi:ParB-like chromosome segregation protein Spo0J
VYDPSQPTNAKSKQLGVFAPGPSDDVKRQPSVKARIAQQNIFDIVREQIPRMKKEIELRAKEAADKKLQVEEEARKEVESRNLAARKEAAAKNAKAIAERAKERAQDIATTEDITKEANVDGGVADATAAIVATAKPKAKATGLKDDASKDAEASDPSGAAEKHTKSATSDEGKKEEK